MKYLYGRNGWRCDRFSLCRTCGQPIVRAHSSARTVWALIGDIQMDLTCSRSDRDFHEPDAEHTTFIYDEEGLPVLPPMPIPSRAR